MYLHFGYKTFPILFFYEENKMVNTKIKIYNAVRVGG